MADSGVNLCVLVRVIPSLLAYFFGRIIAAEYSSTSLSFGLLISAGGPRAAEEPEGTVSPHFMRQPYRLN